VSKQDNYAWHKRQAEIARWEYDRRMNNASHLATMLRGITLGSSFCVVMFWVAGVDSTADVLIWLGFMALGGVSAVEAEHILFLAEQSRYPKSRRRTYRSEVADEWHEFRVWCAERKAKKNK